MKKTFLEWIAYVLLFIWQLPQNIVGMLFWLVFKIKGSVSSIASTKWAKAFKSKSMSGGISLGSFCFLSDYGAANEKLVAHELKGHAWDSRLMGPLYLFIVGIPSLLNAALELTDCYYKFFTEKWANKRAGLTVDEYCKLKFIKEEEPISVDTAFVQVIEDEPELEAEEEPVIENEPELEEEVEPIVENEPVKTKIVMPISEIKKRIEAIKMQLQGPETKESNIWERIEEVRKKIERLKAK